MYGSKLIELKKAVCAFIKFTSESPLNDRIAIVEFGNNTSIRTSLSTRYQYHTSICSSLTHGGGTPMAEGLVLVLKELTDNGNILSFEGVTLMPRIILMTDGEPDDKNKTLVIAKAIGDAGFPIACVGVSGCDRNLLSTIARITGGMFVYASNISDLYGFFVQQFLITMYILKMMKEIENLLNKELLRAFLEQELGRRIDDETLELLISMLQNMVRTDQTQNRGPRRVRAPPREMSDTTVLITPSNYQNAPRKQSSCCTKTVVTIWVISYIASILLIAYSTWGNLEWITIITPDSDKCPFSLYELTNLSIKCNAYEITTSGVELTYRLLFATVVVAMAGWLFICCGCFCKKTCFSKKGATFCLSMLYIMILGILSTYGVLNDINVNCAEVTCTFNSELRGWQMAFAGFLSMWLAGFMAFVYTAYKCCSR